MIDTVAWTLVHFLWQGTLVWFLVSVQLRFLREARTRYAVACGAMLLMLALPFATFMLLADNSRPVIQAGEFVSSTTSFARVAATAAASQTTWMPLVVGLWASGVALFSVRNAGGLVLAYIWRRRASIALPRECHEAAGRLAVRLGLRRTVQLRGSSRGVAPSVVGWLKPVIVIPAAAMRLPFEQLEAVLAHELAHIRRNDFVVNLLQNAAETLLFYHPAVWWLGRRIREERENCCDDIAVAVCGDRVNYARALSSLAELRDRVPDFALAANGGSLVRRIARLLGKSQPATHASSVWLVAVIAVVCGVVALATAQTASTEQVPQATVTPQNQDRLSDPSAPPQPPSPPSGRLISDQSAPPAVPAGTFIRQLAGAGYADLSVDDLISFKIHGVTPEYLQSLKEMGFASLTPDQAVSGRIHGLTLEFVRGLEVAGFSNLTFDQVISARVHGVNTNAVRELRELGLGDLDFDDVISARVHGITPDFVRQAQQLGLRNLTFDKIVALKIHGVLD